MTQLLYVDDIKVFASFDAKLNRVLRSTNTAMQDIGLRWNPKKCNVIHISRGKQVKNAADLKLDETALVDNLNNSKIVLTYLLGNLDESSVRLQPCQGNKPI